ncbi:MAG: hypothetical protein C5B49_08540 [Bdellovibrio sp.]|nr:MAG: hypothetical protein C5B49_08540 [Bdellovibrio sp.]
MTPIKARLEKAKAYKSKTCSSGGQSGTPSGGPSGTREAGKPATGKWTIKWKTVLKRTMSGAAFVLAATPAWGEDCPKLEGEYSCTYKGFTKQLSVERKEANGVVIYNVDNGGEIYADGKSHHADQLHPILDSYASSYDYTAICGSNTLQFSGTAVLRKGGQGQVSGALLKQDDQLNVSLRLKTPTKDTSIVLPCVKE